MKRMSAISGEVSSQEQAGLRIIRAACLPDEARDYGIDTIPSSHRVRNFETYSLVWRDVHMTYLQIAVEGNSISDLYLLFFSRGQQS